MAILPVNVANLFLLFCWVMRVNSPVSVVILYCCFNIKHCTILGPSSCTAIDNEEPNEDSTFCEVQSDSDELYYFSSSGDELWTESSDDDEAPGDDLNMLELFSDNDDVLDSHEQPAQNKPEQGNPSMGLDDLLYAFPIA